MGRSETWMLRASLALVCLTTWQYFFQINNFLGGLVLPYDPVLLAKESNFNLTAAVAGMETETGTRTANAPGAMQSTPIIPGALQAYPHKPRKKTEVLSSLKTVKKLVERFEPIFPGPCEYAPKLPVDPSAMPSVIDGCGALDNGQASDRDVDGIQIHAIGWKREKGMARLLNNLEAADYSGWELGVSLHIHIDGGSSKEVNSIVRSFRWSHGEKHLDIRKTNSGLREMWLSSIGDAAAKAGNNTLLLVFEDDIKVSPAYFQWLLAMIDRYSRYPRCRDSNLAGFSLSPLVYQEMYSPMKSWNANDFLLRREGHHEGDPTASAYLSAVPSSWGAAYWSDRWNEFDKFAKLRMEPSFYYFQEEENGKGGHPKERKLSPPYLMLPDETWSNYWTKSWKRFMVDFFYARGLVMMYPNLKGQQGLAYSKQDDGVHGGAAHDGNYAADLVPEMDWEKEGELPPYGEMTILGMDHRPKTKEQLMAIGADFLNSIPKNCTSKKACSDLLSSWSKETVPGLVGDADVPILCVPDAYTSTATMHQKPVASSLIKTDKYLLLEPQEPRGNNPVFMTLRQDLVYAWSRALGRRLILPSKDDGVLQMRSEVKREWRALAEIDDNDGSDSGTINFEEFLQLGLHPWRMLHLDPLNNGTIRTEPTGGMIADLLKHHHLLEKRETVNLQHLADQKLSLKQVRHFFGACDDQVLVLKGIQYSLFGLDPK